MSSPLRVSNEVADQLIWVVGSWKTMLVVITPLVKVCSEPGQASHWLVPGRVGIGVKRVSRTAGSVSSVLRHRRSLAVE